MISPRIVSFQKQINIVTKILYIVQASFNWLHYNNY